MAPDAGLALRAGSEAFELAPEQRALLLHPAAAGVACAQLVLSLAGDLDVAGLRAALGTIAARHEILRTTFRRVPGVALPLQAVAPAPAVAWHAADRDAADADLAGLLRADRARPFDLDAGPPLRATLVTSPAGTHVLVVTIPAACADGATLANLARELPEAYAARADGTARHRAVLQYAEFAAWRNELLDGPEAAEGREYWRRREAGDVTAPVLPSEREAAAPHGAAPGVLPVALADEVRAGADRAAAAHGTTPAAFWLACWHALVWRLTGRADLVLGVRLPGRGHPELEDAFGPFAVTVPLGWRWEAGLPFATALGGLDRAVREAEQWQEAWDPTRAPAALRAGIGFEFGTAPAPATAAGVAFSVLALRGPGAETKVELSCLRVGGTLHAELRYDAARFARPDVERLAAQLAALATSATRAPETAADRLAMSTDAEREHLARYNDTRADWPAGRCTHELFAEQAARSPDAPAVAAGGRTLTFAELNARANQVAHYLRARGVGPDTLVPLCVERSADMVVGLLGILKAGGAYVPLDPGHPADRLAFVLADTRAAVALTQERLSDRFDGTGVETVRLDADRDAIAAESAADPACRVDPEGLAYVIYTSGSTGRPKGVMVPHRGLVNYLSWCARAYRVAEGRGAPVHSPLAFDLTVTSLLSPLLAGRTVLLVSEAAGVEGLAAALGTGTDLSLVKLTPAHLDVLAALLPPASAGGRTRALVIGGEALQAQSLAFWRAHAPETRLVNEYGPTETVVGCATYDVPPDASCAGSVPIGRPIQNVRLYVLDEHMTPAPFGVPGELYVGGVGLARGYLNRPDLTAEAFVADPFADLPGQRLYRTGDVARFRPDGDLEFLGRRDHQVKVRGHRIELGEIETVLAQHPAVREAAVLAREDAPGDRRLVAYVAGRPDERPAAAALRAFLKDRLPDYMLPARVVVLDALPLTANGKVDRRALPATERTADDREGLVAARDPVELELVRLWEECLRVSPIGVHDDFFELGGHSLLAVRLMYQIQACFGRQLPLSSLFEAGTIAHQAEVLRQGPAGRIASPLVAIEPRGTRRPLFFVHPAGGHAFGYTQLARLLGPDQPFYALQAQDLGEDRRPDGRVEDIAARYVEAIRTVQPAGPHLLGGSSFGGVVAYEMAQQLARRGEPVALLALLDTSAPVAGYRVVDLDEVGRLLHLLTVVGGFYGRTVTLSAAELRRLDADARLARVLEVARAADLVPSGVGVREVQAFVDVHRAHMDALRRYRPAPYPGTVTLFRAAETGAHGLEHRADAADPALGWTQVATTVHVVDVPGDHVTMLARPHVDALATRLRDVVARTETATPPFAPAEAVGPALVGGQRT